MHLRRLSLEFQDFSVLFSLIIFVQYGILAGMEDHHATACTNCHGLCRIWRSIPYPHQYLHLWPERRLLAKFVVLFHNVGVTPSDVESQLRLRHSRGTRVVEWPYWS